MFNTAGMLTLVQKVAFYKKNIKNRNFAKINSVRTLILDNGPISLFAVSMTTDIYIHH